MTQNNPTRFRSPEQIAADISEDIALSGFGTGTHGDISERARAAAEMEAAAWKAAYEQIYAATQNDRENADQARREALAGEVMHIANEHISHLGREYDVLCRAEIAIREGRIPLEP